MKIKMFSAMLATLLLASCGSVETSGPETTDSSKQEVKVVTVSEPETESLETTDSSTESANAETSKTDSLESESDSSISDSEAEGKEVETTQDDNSAEFAAGLLLAACKDDILNGKNAFISPLSVKEALGMTMNGAKGKTLNEMRDVLCGNISLRRFNQLVEQRQERYNSEEGVTIRNTNSVWINSKWIENLEEDFTDILDNSYQTECIVESFEEGTEELINGWVALNTLGMIPSVIENLDYDSAMVLVNAVAFDGKWEETFAEDKIDENGVFHDCKGNDLNVAMLGSKEHIYLSSSKASGFIKPYAGGNFGFMGILPEGDIKDYINNFDAHEWETLIHSKTHDDVFVKMPEFSSEYGKSLNEALENMGIKQAFSDLADFSGMTKDYPLRISEVTHKAVINLDRNGTKAAAVTSVEMSVNSVVPADEIHYVYLDRPFMYAIVDMSTFEPIFMGVHQTVEKESL